MTKEMIHDITKQLFHEVIDEISMQLSTDTVRAGHLFMLQTEYVCNELINDLVSCLVRSHLLIAFTLHCVIFHRQPGSSLLSTYIRAVFAHIHSVLDYFGPLSNPFLIIDPQPGNVVLSGSPVKKQLQYSPQACAVADRSVIGPV